MRSTFIWCAYTIAYTIGDEYGLHGLVKADKKCVTSTIEDCKAEKLLIYLEEFYSVCTEPTSKFGSTLTDLLTKRLRNVTETSEFSELVKRYSVCATDLVLWRGPGGFLSFKRYYCAYCLSNFADPDNSDVSVGTDYESDNTYVDEDNASERRRHCIKCKKSNLISSC